MTPAISPVLDFLADSGVKAWLVGGTVRDLLMGRDPDDIDLVTEGPPEETARRFADSIGGSFYNLSERFQSCRVLSADGSLVYDFARRRGNDIEMDLHERDFTVNAIAAELPVGEIIDPLGGLGDLDSRRLAAVDDNIFDQDALRLVRAPRLEKELGFEITGRLERLIRKKSVLATRPAIERVWAELVRLLEAPGAAAAIRRLDSLELLEVLLPELHALKGIVQNAYHHLDVFNHVLAATDALDSIIEDPRDFFPGQADKIIERSNRRIAGDTSWRFVMSYSALMHDIAKPCCRFTDEAGDIRFFEHARIGAEMVTEILTRMHASGDTINAVSHLVLRHMRFEGLKQEYPPSNRARLRYIRATQPLTPEAIILSVSDQLAVRGPKTTEAAVQRHLSLAREMMGESFELDEAVEPPKLVNGEDLMKELPLKPGPMLGNILDRICEEQQLGNICSRREAIELAERIMQEEKRGI